jgi:signal transduction histidine kinase
MRVFVPAVCLRVGLLAAHGGSETNTLARISEVKALSGAELQKGRDVRFRGIVTAQLSHNPVVQDGDTGIFVSLNLARNGKLWQGDDAVVKRLQPGSVVEVAGVASRSSYAPAIAPRTIALLGEAPLPEAVRTTAERFFRGLDDCRRVEVQGLVQGYWLRRPFGVMLILDSPGGRFMAKLPLEALDQCACWVDAEVRLRGVGTASFNTRREMIMPTLCVNSANDVEVVQPASCGPFEAPKVALHEIDGYRMDFQRTRRQRVEGIVTYVERGPDSSVQEAVRAHRLADVVQDMGRLLYLQEGLHGLCVQTRQTLDVQPGDRVEVSGFVDRNRIIRGLCEAVVRKIAPAEIPAPLPISIERLLEINEQSLVTGTAAEPSDFDGVLVTCEATLAEDLRTNGGEWVLLLKSSRISFSALLHEARRLDAPRLRAGSRLRLTGIVMLDFWQPPVPAPVAQPRLKLLLRSTADVVVLRQPSWWTVPRLLVALAVMLVVVLSGLCWVWLLHRRINATTRILTAEVRGRREAALEYAATLRERNRLAANLHDTLLQTLGGIKYQLAACQKGGIKTEPQLEVAKRMVGHAADELRNSVWLLRSLSVKGQHFAQTLCEVAERARQGRSVEVQCRMEGELADVPEFVGGGLLLIIQEALLNALKHATPNRIAIVVHRDGSRIEVEVRDDGKGFVAEEAQSARAGHFGLVVMRERAERLGGTFAVESRPGGGAAVRVSVPLKDYDADVADPDEAAERGGGGEAAR